MTRYMMCGWQRSPSKGREEEEELQLVNNEVTNVMNSPQKLTLHPDTTHGVKPWTGRAVLIGGGAGNNTQI